MKTTLFVALFAILIGVYGHPEGGNEGNGGTHRASDSGSTNGHEST